MSARLFIMNALIALAIGAASPTTAEAESTGAVEGRATIAEGGPASDAEVTLVQLRERRSVDPSGEFRFDAVPPGDYLVEVTSVRHGRWVEAVTVVSGETARLEIVLENVAHKEEILVSGSAIGSQLDVANPSNVLSGDELQARLQSSIGETLANEPGVSSTYFGPGSSRPVIRGLGSDRVRMLETGVDAGDASTASPDHAVSIEPAHAERIEVLRGPATLLYGSSAIGGVVNVIDGLIPSVQIEPKVSGHLDLRGGSVNDEKTGSISLEGGLGGWGWHLHALERDTGDFEIPGRAEVTRSGAQPTDDEGEPERGRVANSDVETTSAGLGVTRFFENRGFLGISVSGYESNYGVPGVEEHDAEDEEGEEGEEGGLRIDAERRRFDLRSEATRGFGPFQGFKVRVGLVDYEHDEVEPSGEVGTTFFTDSYEGRLELIQSARDGHTGSFGLQIRSRDLEAIGEEAFIPANDTRSLALFTFQELRRGDVSFQFGARFENQENDADGLPGRSFDGASGSIGIVWDLSEKWSLAGSLARSTKFPSGEELYSNGAHFATQAFEVGNPRLDEETSIGLDLSLRKVEGRLTWELTLFRNVFSDFIFQALTGAQQDGLPELLFSQADADFEGVELQGEIELWQRGHRHLGLDLFGDYVRAELSDTGANLPRIPPMRLGGGVHYRSDRWNARVELLDVDRQDRLAPDETPTSGHTTVHASAGYRFFTQKAIYDVMIRGRNLTDEEARNHVSFLKDRVPLPGRDLGVSLRITF